MATMKLARRFETVAGSRVAFLETPGTHPIIFVHGFFTSCMLWSRLFEHAGANGRLHLLAPDMEGFGDTVSPGQTDMGFERQNEFLTQFLLAKCGMRPVSVVAHAHGAIPALMLAIQKPGLVADLTLVSPVLADGFPDALARPFLWAARSRLGWEAWFRTGLARAHVERHMRLAFLERGADAESIIGDFWRPFENSASARQRLQRVFEEMDARLVKAFCRHLDRIRVPVRIVAGRMDRLTDSVRAAAWSSRFPQGSALTVDAGHFVPLENPGAILEILEHHDFAGPNPSQ